jgi:hypothetical protein
MALNIRNVPNAVLAALVASTMAFRREQLKAAASKPHYDITATTSGDYQAPVATPAIMSSASASDLPSVIVRANEAKAVLNAHIADEVAHERYGSAIATADATDQATANTLLNAIKTAFNAHGASTSYHIVADATYVVTAANATNLASSIDLANELYTMINGHIQFAPTSPQVVLVAP